MSFDHRRSPLVHHPNNDGVASQKLNAAATPCTTTTVHTPALDSIVNVNSLFTFAVFLGLNLNTSSASSASNAACSAGPSVARYLVSFHVYSFASFLFSSIVALALKEIIRIAHCGAVVVIGVGGHTEPIAICNTKLLQIGTVASAAGSILGCGFLTAAMVNLVQIRLGSLACADWYNLLAVISLATLIPSALCIYMYFVLYAFIQGACPIYSQNAAEEITN